MIEIWNDIESYEGLYQVSNLGNVRSVNYNHTKQPKNLTLKKHHSGYRTVMLCKEGVKTNRTVHSLVASAFIENPLNLPVVNHIDGDKSNNTVNNLEWVTYKQNTSHAINSGLRKDSNMRGRKGSASPIRKPILQYAKDGTFIKEWSCISEASRILNCKPCTITNCAQGRIKSCKGYVWKYGD